jgi:hypothetical protein
LLFCRKLGLSLGGDEEMAETKFSPDKDAARRIWALIQKDAADNGIPQCEWKWQSFAEFWQVYAEDVNSRGVISGGVK